MAEITTRGVGGYYRNDSPSATIHGVRFDSKLLAIQSAENLHNTVTDGSLPALLWTWGTNGDVKIWDILFAILGPSTPKTEALYSKIMPCLYHKSRR